VEISTSRGNSRKRVSKPPASALGHSTSAVTSSSSSSSMSAWPPSDLPTAVDLLANQRAARGEVRDHLALLAQRGFVVRGLRQRQIARRHEAMAARGAAGVGVEHARRHQLAAVQHHQPVHRPHELRVDEPQRMRFGIGSASSARCTMPGSRLTVVWPASGPRSTGTRPCPRSRAERADLDAAFLRELERRGGGLPSLPKPRSPAGP
jgi:hypothetical protein